MIFISVFAPTKKNNTVERSSGSVLTVDNRFTKSLQQRRKYMVSKCVLQLFNCLVQIMSQLLNNQYLFRDSSIFHHPVGSPSYFHFVLKLFEDSISMKSNLRFTFSTVKQAKITAKVNLLERAFCKHRNICGYSTDKVCRNFVIFMP
jgi:hypothetical protein